MDHLRIIYTNNSPNSYYIIIHFYIKTHIDALLRIAKVGGVDCKSRQMQRLEVQLNRVQCKIKTLDGNEKHVN